MGHVGQCQSRGSNPESLTRTLRPSVGHNLKVRHASRTCWMLRTEYKSGRHYRGLQGMYSLALERMMSHLGLHGLSRWCSGKESTCKCRKLKRYWFDPWVRNIPCSRKWQPATVFLPGKSHGQRSLEATVHGVAKSWTPLSNWTQRSR